ncbi:ATP-binding protein [candidate division CSSED10-310 bacterium]|uniref:histidine kinase n=1 Tax=candidate division CSSED10-310 bacterium TaxID=2855610 RepID=A0ABV6YTG2_UNCC1
MKKFPLSQQDYLDIYLKTAQLLAGLSTRQEVLSLLQELLIIHYGADIACCAVQEQRGFRKNIVCRFSDMISPQTLSEKKLKEIIQSFMEKGILTATIIRLSEPLSVAILPVIDESQIRIVMVVGHYIPEAIPQELFHLYQAVADLTATIINRMTTESGMANQIKQLEDVVIDSTTEMTEIIKGLEDEIIGCKKTLETLPLSEVNKQRLFDNSQDGVMILDAETGIILEANPFIQKLLGYSLQELRGKKLWEIGLVRDTDLNLEAFMELQNKKYIRYDNLPLRAKNGQRIEVEFISNIYKINQTTVIQCNIRDITDRKNIERKLAHYTEELELRNQDLDAFAHTVAHDLKNPLTSMVGFASHLQRNIDILPDQARDLAVQTILNNAKTMNSIINALLLLASVRKELIEIEPVEMKTIVANALLRLTEFIKENHAEIVLPETWPASLGYQPWIEEIWVNLISNAIKYGGQPPRVELGASLQTDGMIRFFVRDNGAGVSPEQKDSLFKPFSKLGQVRVDGHGLGLSIVRVIVEKLNGQVGMESEAGQGSTVYFTAPALEQQAVNELS